MKKFNILTGFILMIAAPHIKAGEIDFTDEAGDGLTTFQQVIQGSGASVGVVATFQNPIVDAGSNVFFNISNGLALGTGGLGSSWEVVFDSTVELHSYTIDFSSGNIPFDINGMGVNLVGLSNAQGTVTPATPITFLANEVYTFSIQPPVGFGGLTFSSWTFDPAAAAVVTPVPTLSPVSLAFFVMLISLIALIGFRHHFSGSKG